jgi:hypothetical protein
MLRILLGRLGPLGTQYGLQLFDEFGRVQWNFATGATANGIEDASVTTAKIRVGALIAEHLDVTRLFIRDGAQMANAIIDNAKITDLAVTNSKIANLAVTTAKVNDLSVTKLITGTMAAFAQIGVGNQIYLDGPNGNMHIYDQQSTPVLRSIYGKQGTGTAYGLTIWNAAGQLMYDFTQGTWTPGTGDGSITTPKIVTNAVTESATLVSPGLVTTDASYDTAGGVATGALLAGDRLWVVYKAVGSLIGSTSAELEARLQEDSGAGTILDAAYLKDAGIGAVVLQTVWTAPTALASKTFVVTFHNAIGSDLVGISNQVYIVLRLQR